ncbi:restriction endonuclease subunit S [Denitromonas iodatirespirans]|uniref:Restriction endonuclease subunit S n=1 Tax=Denitromonas iodatirespirans TaxID=2795389 RepID=A0A944DCY6_DENI1|nr:restriction endonuclease subunit S [Denitromonas iodatirespirans]MBT0964199.1 restriction endonuclease subunit S [Denitromonas iodatirespirans]
MAKAEKTAMVPRLRFPEFREAWEEKELRSFLTESRIPGSDGSIAKKLTVKLWGRGVFEKAEAIKGSASTVYYKRKAGQFIYSKLDFLNQAFGVIPAHLDGFESTVDLPCFDVDARLNSRFLLEYVQRKDFYKRFGEIADGGRKAKRIQVDSFLSFQIVVPKEKKEQQKIADCLGSLDELIAAQGRKVEALKTYKRGLMQQLFPREGETRPRLRFPVFRDAPEWKGKKLSAVVDLVSGLHLSPDEYSTVGDVPYFTGPSDFTNDVHFGTKWTRESTNTAKEHDTLITVKGSGVGEVWYLEITSVAMGRQLMAVRAKACLSRFIFQLLLTKRSRFEDLAAGNLIPGLARGDILNIVAPIPEEDEQRQIAGCLSSLDAQIATEADKLETLKTHKAGLMQQLFPSLENK